MYVLLRTLRHPDWCSNRILPSFDIYRHTSVDDSHKFAHIGQLVFDNSGRKYLNALLASGLQLPSRLTVPVEILKVVFLSKFPIFAMFLNIHKANRHVFKT